MSPVILMPPVKLLLPLRATVPSPRDDDLAGARLVVDVGRIRAALVGDVTADRGGLGRAKRDALAALQEDALAVGLARSAIAS
jgi:hypothetical protein